MRAFAYRYEKGSNVNVRLFIALACALAATPALAQVKVENPWIRASAPGQDIAAAYMRLEASAPASLVGGSTPAGKLEVHQTKREGNVMRMLPVDRIDVAPGKPVELKPGGYHIMITGLHAPVKAGETVPLTLQFQTKDGKRSSVTVQAPVQPLASTGMDRGHGGMDMKH